MALHLNNYTYESKASHSWENPLSGNISAGLRIYKVLLFKSSRGIYAKARSVYGQAWYQNVEAIWNWNNSHASRKKQINFIFVSDETVSLSYAEKFFKLYDGVETFVMFIGYPRSSHSLVGAILDAHPEVNIPHQYVVIKYWKKYRPSTARKTKMSKYHLFYDLHKLSREQALFGSRSKNAKLQGYSYNVPGLWQGGHQTRIKVRW